MSILRGYTPQPQWKLDLVNGFKELEETVQQELDELKNNAPLGHEVNQRWLAIGITHLEQAFMAINRAILQPQRLSLEEKNNG